MARTFEGPMDWEYQDRGPLDPTSPFSQAANNAKRNLFASRMETPSRPSSAFAGLSTPSKPHPTPPQSSRFTPQLTLNNMEPPFRNPAFTTPRRPVEEVLLSEASGAEDSPALTEASEYPNDTPDADRKMDAAAGSSTMTPLRLDKVVLQAKLGLSSKKHTSGKGEMQGRENLSLGLRKRKRHNFDRDVSAISRHYHARDGDVWDSESDIEDRNSMRNTSHSRKEKSPSQRPGAFESFFYALNKYPNTPDHMQRWMQFGANLFLVSVLAYLGWSVVSTVRSDIHKANDLARQELMNRMTECQNQYTMNECAKKDRPALRLMCEEWYDCMMQNPESILRVKVTAKQVAEIINEFSETMHLKAWGILLAFILVCTTVNFGALSRQNGHKSIIPPPSARSSVSASDTTKSTAITPGYMLVPVHTTRMPRRTLLDEGTDTDTSPLNPKSNWPLPTPSGRKATNKEDRQQSPVKFGRGLARAGT